MIAAKEWTIYSKEWMIAAKEWMTAAKERMIAAGQLQIGNYELRIGWRIALRRLLDRADDAAEFLGVGVDALEFRRGEVVGVPEESKPERGLAGFLVRDGEL